ncbi:YbaN family protein [Planctomycetota bacterium]
MVDSEKQQHSKNRIVRFILVISGSVSVGLGIIGIFLPVLPTTPFLLLAAACYARSSDRFYHWLLNNRWFGKYISNYREGKGILLRHKITALSLLWLLIGYAALFVVVHVWIRILLFAIALGVTIHIFKIKTYRL